MSKDEHIVAEDTREAVRLRLGRLTSPTLCKRMLAKAKHSLPDAVLDEKAQGVAWSIRSALGYWDSGGHSLNARILSRYYALMQVSIAEQVASLSDPATLEKVQRATQRGHGLLTVESAEGL